MTCNAAQWFERRRSPLRETHLRNKRNAYSGVRRDQLAQDLSANVPQQIFDMFANERILHDARAVGGQDRLERSDIVVLICAKRHKEKHALSQQL